MEVNNISFTGVVYPQHMFPKEAKKIEMFVIENKPVIDTLEKKFETDIRISDDADSVIFLHRRLVGLKKFGMEPLSFENFTKNAENILNSIRNAIFKAQN